MMRNHATWIEVDGGRRYYYSPLAGRRARVWSGRNIAAAMFLLVLAVPFVFCAILAVGAR